MGQKSTSCTLADDWPMTMQSARAIAQPAEQDWARPLQSARPAPRLQGPDDERLRQGPQGVPRLNGERSAPCLGLGMVNSADWALPQSAAAHSQPMCRASQQARGAGQELGSFPAAWPSERSCRMAQVPCMQLGASGSGSRSGPLPCGSPRFEGALELSDAFRYVMGGNSRPGAGLRRQPAAA